MVSLDKTVKKQKKRGSIIIVGNKTVKRSLVVNFKQSFLKEDTKATLTVDIVVN